MSTELYFIEGKKMSSLGQFINTHTHTHTHTHKVSLFSKC